MTDRLPEFIVGGGPRCGTTWLATTLDRHPRIWLAKPLRPEPKFFLVDELYAEGLDSYAHRWFNDAPSDAVVGEKSTNYLESPTAAGRIATDLPDVRMVFVLRNPVDRALSNYRWSVMNGMESADLATALALEERREAEVPPHLRYARPHAYFARGCYAQMLAPYLEALPAGRVQVLRFEDLVADPGAVTARVHEFLGVEPRPDLAGSTVGVNAAEVTVEVDPAVREDLARRYAPLNRELVELLGPSFELWPEVTHS